MAERIAVIIAVTFACAYGVKQNLCGFKRKYFSVVLCGMMALLLSRLYYLILILSDGNDEILTVGVLGQASAYIFFMTANISFLSRDILAKMKNKVCIPGIVGAIIIGTMFITSAVKLGTVYAYIGEIIYTVSMGSAFYVSINAISYRKENKACGAVYKFNICVCALVVINALFEITVVTVSGIYITFIIWVLTIISMVIIAVMIPLLRKGMDSWQQ